MLRRPSDERQELTEAEREAKRCKGCGLKFFNVNKACPVCNLDDWYAENGARNVHEQFMAYYATKPRKPKGRPKKGDSHG